MQDASSGGMSATAEEFLAAVKAGRLDRADELLPGLKGSTSLPILRKITDLHISRSRWSEAAAVADTYAAGDFGATLKRNLARNFAAMKVHRPAVYNILTSAPASDRYSIVPGADQYPTIGRKTIDGKVESLSQENQPRAAMVASLKALEGTRNAQTCFAFCGIGDGYLLKALAVNPPKLILGMEQAAYVIEPDAALLCTAMMLHDYSGSDGPIEQTRFEWFIGRDWQHHFRDAILGDASHLYPQFTISSSPTAAAIEAEMISVFRESYGVDERLAQQIEAYYAGVRAGDLAALMGDKPVRQPRVLLLTTRFSTVLQYSTRDAADGFRQLGWDARVLIEPANHHALLPGFIRRALAEFKPDVVFQLDHLRHEHGKMFPANLPFVCWVQDHLANLTDVKAGAAITLRDFVLGANNTMYRDRYGYPARQLVDMPKLTRVPVRPEAWTSGGEDLTYVSNASMTPEDCAASLLKQWPENSPVRLLMAEVMRRMGEIYSRGEILGGPYAVRQLMLAVAEEMKMELHPGPALDGAVSALFDRLNNVLFRQQALHWVADLADEMGLRLALYGGGWEKHPRFGKYARGTIQYGEELEQHTRETKINLQIVPSFCLHQRFLDGLVAGGFFLVREHPADRGMVDLCNFLAAEMPAAETAQQIRATVGGEELVAFEEIMSRNSGLLDVGDPVELARGCMRSQVIAPPAKQAVPRLDEVSFSNRDELRRRLDRFLSNANLRAEIAQEQRQNVEQRLSYAAGIRRVVRRIRELLASEMGAVEKAA